MLIYWLLQTITKRMAYWINALPLPCRVVHVERNTYTDPDDVMLCAKPKVYATVLGNQSRRNVVWLLNLPCVYICMAIACLYVIVIIKILQF